MGSTGDSPEKHALRLSLGCDAGKVRPPMPERTLEQRWRLLAASFRDGPEGREAAGRFGDGFRPALDLCCYALSHDVGLPPPEVDGEHLRELLRNLLPGRIEGGEPWRGDVPEVLGEFLKYTAAAETLSAGWQWATIVEDERGAYMAALRNGSRTRLGAASKQVPDRRPAPKLGRNEPCFCGSGKKYKQCCWKLT